MPLSVVIATTHPWPELEMTLNSLWDQIQHFGAELIIADGDGRGLPVDFSDRFPGTVLIRRPGASIFVLRSLGMQHAHGEIVAITEDHCRLCADWCAGMLETHRLHPEAAVVGGSVENGSPHALIDWANFFVAHAPLMRPVQGGEAEGISLAGASFKRSALPKQYPEQGVMEMLYLREMRRSGGKLFTNSAISLHHVQSYGFWPTFAVHYHNGRSIAGFRKPGLGPAALVLRILSCALVPAFLLSRSTVCILRKRRFVRELLLSFPLIASLVCCHAAGELVGYCAGAGNSPARLS